MREIKCRAWDNKNKCFWKDDYQRFDLDLDGTIVLFGDSDGGKDGLHEHSEYPEKDRFILEQFTGLQDKHGREIYEGDILSVDDGVRTVRVLWHKYCAGFDTEPIHITSQDEFVSLRNHSWHLRCVIVGNIHENPELLEAK